MVYPSGVYRKQELDKIQVACPPGSDRPWPIASRLEAACENIPFEMFCPAEIILRGIISEAVFDSVLPLLHWVWVLVITCATEKSRTISKGN
jgi:hypothetical protein